LVSVTTILKYNLGASVGSVGDNPFKSRAKLEQLQNFTYTDKLNKLTELNISVPNNEYTKANAFPERKMYLPLVTPFRGFVTDFAEDEKEIDLIGKEFATHLERRIFRDDEEDEIVYTSENWYNKLWKRRIKYTVLKLNVVDNIKKFPILLDLGANISFKNNALPTANDFVVTTKDGVTKIPHDIESWDKITGELVLWLKLPKVSDTGNVDFYVYYGNPDASDQRDTVNVWKECYEVNDGTTKITFDYAMVQHLSSDSVDATENNNDGTDTDITYVGSQSIESKIGGAAQFNATTSEIDCASGASVDNIWATGGWATFWFNVNSDGEGSAGRLLGKNDWGLRTRDEANGFINVDFYHLATGNGSWKFTTAEVPLNKWNRIDVTFDKSNINNVPTFYLNGEVRTVGNGLQEVENPTGSFNDDASQVVMIGNEPGGTKTIDGEIDEVRLMKNPPPHVADIIKTEYNIQNQQAVNIKQHAHEIYNDQVDNIAQNVVDSANKDMPTLKSMEIDGLVSLWRFNNDLQDSKGTHHGTVAAGTEKYVAGRYARDKQIEFDGSTNYATVPHSSDHESANFSIALQVTKTSEPASFARVIEKDSATGGWTILFNALTVRAVYIAIADSVGATLTNTSSVQIPLPVGKPRYYVWSIDNDNKKIRCFEDGVFVGEISGWAGTFDPTSGDPFAFGAASGGGSKSPIKIDDVRYYNRAITDNEAKMLWEATQSDIDIIERNVKWVVGDGEATEIPNLVSLYKFENDVLDAKAENNGTVLGTEQYTDNGVYNRGFDFDGSTRIQLDNESAFDIFEYNLASTISFWIRWDGTVGGRPVTKNSGNNTTGLQTNCANGGILIYKMINTVSTNELNVSSDNTFDDNKWHHVVWTKSTLSDDAGLTLYVDGVVEPTTTSVDNLSATILHNNPVMIGGNFDGTNQMKGQMDDVRIYSRELTADEVSLLYRSTDSGIDTVRVDGFPTKTTSVSLVGKNNWEALDELALQIGKDLWFDNKNNLVHIGTKGKEIKEKLDIQITTKPEKKTENFSNIINVVGKKQDGGKRLKKTVETQSLQRYNYEKMVSNNKLGVEGQLDDIADSLLGQFQTLTPQIKAKIPYEQFVRFDIQSGDTIKIARPDLDINGTFRFMDITARRNGANVSLEDVKAGKIRYKSNSLSDFIGTLVKKLNEDSLGS
jgi:hypothetical protein